MKKVMMSYLPLYFRSIPIIAGGVIGGVACLLILIVVILLIHQCCCKKTKIVQPTRTVHTIHSGHTMPYRGKYLLSTL